MPIEDIKVVKAPKGWKPNADQAAEAARDSRLSRMSADDQYQYFSKPKGSVQGKTARAVEGMKGAANNALSWTPRSLLSGVSDAYARATGQK